MNEKMPSEKTEALKQLVGMLSWQGLKTFVEPRKTLLRKFEVGGFHLDKKNRSRLERIITKEISKDDIIYIFLDWYHEQNTYVNCLDPYFESDEYRTWVENKELEAGKYLLSDEKFSEFVGLLGSEHALLFLHLSPIKLSEQQKQILHQHASMLKQDTPIDSSPSEPTQAESILKAEILALKKQVKFYKREYEQLTDDLQKSHAETDKLKSKNKALKDKLITFDHIKAEIEIGLKSDIDHLKDRINELEQEVKNYKTTITGLSNSNEDKVKQIGNLKTKLKRIEENNDVFFHNIIQHLNYEKIVSCLNAPNDVQEILATVVRPPSTDDAVPPENTANFFDSFWQELMKKEEVILRNILLVCAKDVFDKSYYDTWADRIDDFNDLKSSLSARIFLADTLYELLRRYYCNEL
jgi:sugar-specific transcriptional regulator TrmB